MKYTVSLFAITLLLSCSMFAQDNSVFGPNNINIDYNLYKTNKVKSIKGYRYKKEEAKGKGKLISYELIDTTGKLTEEFSYYSGEYHRKYEYNVKGYLSKDIGYVLNSPVEKKYYCKYDDKGRVIQKEEGDDSRFSDKYYYTYDTAGNLSKIKWLMGADEPSTFYFTDIFEYSKNNKLIKMTRHDRDASIYFYKTYEYDTAGNLAMEIRFEKSMPTDVWEYRYDSNNNCIEKEWSDSNTKDHTLSKITYSANGLVLSHPGYKGFIKYIYEYY